MCNDQVNLSNLYSFTFMFEPLIIHYLIKEYIMLLEKNVISKLKILIAYQNEQYYRV